MEQEFQAPASGTQAIDRAAQLLSLILTADRPRPLGELAADAAMPKSTASRLLSALERQGLVQQEGSRGGFRAGPIMLRFAHRALADRSLADLAEEAMQVLSDATGETINLAVAGPAGVEHLAQVDTTHYLGTGQWVGRRVPFHATAVGKVLLAFGAAPAPQELPALTPYTITDRARLEQELEQVRASGFATAADELEVGLTAIAAAVFDEAGAVVAALSVSGPTLRLPPRRVQELEPVVVSQAHALSLRLGHRHEGAHAA